MVTRVLSRVNSAYVQLILGILSSFAPAADLPELGTGMVQLTLRRCREDRCCSVLNSAKQHRMIGDATLVRPVSITHSSTLR